MDERVRGGQKLNRTGSHSQMEIYFLWCETAVTMVLFTIELIKKTITVTEARV